MKKNSLSFLLCILTISLVAQNNRPNMKFGTVSEADLSTKIYSIDSSAQAVVIYDKCEVKYEGSNSGYFNVIYKYQRKVHILNKNAFRLATVVFPLFKYGNQEDRVEKLEAVTYNLVDGKVVKTKIDKGSIFKDRVQKDATLMKFTFPDIKEGSIIEYAYTINSPTPHHLREWEFQGQDPVSWSEYNVQVPSIYYFQVIRQGYKRFTIDTVAISNDTYYILFPGESATESSSVGSIKLNTFNSTWAMKDVPALKMENFTTTLDNHISKVSFELSSLKYPNQPAKKISADWYQVAEDLLKDEDFGADLSSKNGWMEDELKVAVGGEQDSKLKAKKVYEYVRDHYTCTGHNARYLSQPIKKVFQAKKGNVTDLNLLLVAMYRNLGYTANPVILSTRPNGWTSELFPLIHRYNYTICQLNLEGEKVLLDASYSKLGFGKLINDCYNGAARLIDKYPLIINLSADSVKESKLTTVFITNKEKGVSSVTYNSTYGNFESFDLREKLSNQKTEDFFADIKKQYSFDINITEKNIDGLKEYENPLKVEYTYTFNTDDDIIYFTPLLNEAHKENPFKAAERYYPVEMPYTVNKTFILNFQTPEGYEIDELPKSARVMLNEKDGMFEYLIGKTADGVQLRCSLKINKANFTNEDYETLRDFYGYVVKKEAEQIVFKKKK